MSTKNKKKDFANLLDKLDNTSIDVPMQKVIPIIDKKVIVDKSKEFHYNLFIDKNIMKKIKHLAIMDEKTIKETITDSLIKTIEERNI